MKVAVTCENCGKHVKKPYCHTKVYKHHFCCQECSQKWHLENPLPIRNSKVKCLCTNCGTEIERYPCKVNRSKHVFCSHTCSDIWHRGENAGFYGKHHTTESKKKLSIAHKALGLFGEKNVAWKGGVSFEPYCEKFNDDFRERVRAFFDNECIICGRTEEEEGKKLAVHHVDYDKKVCCNDRPPMFACVCQTHNAMANHSRERWRYIFHYIIDELYGGKSFYTRNEYYG